VSAPRVALRGTAKVHAEGAMTALAPTRLEGADEAARDLEVAEGEIACLIGPMGCGKSTLLRLVAGIEAPSAGVVLHRGAPRAGAASDTALMAQDAALPEGRSLRDGLSDGPHGAAGAARMLRALGLQEAAALEPRQASHGMRRRAALGRALLSGADLVLLDAPVASLDPAAAALARSAILAARAEGRTLILALESPLDAVLLADRIVAMAEGPNRIVSIRPVTLPRPRAPADPRVAALAAALARFG